MKVTLNIENDKELRSYIKDMIKGQVLSIVREEFVEMIKLELERKVKGTNDYAFNNMQKQAMYEAINNILRKECGVGNWNADFVKPIVSELVSKAVVGKDWKSMVDQLAKEKVQSLLNK